MGLELVLIWMALLPRPFRIVLFWILAPLQIGIIITSNYAFLNYLVLALGILLLDDAYLADPAGPFAPAETVSPADTAAPPSASSTNQSRDENVWALAQKAISPLRFSASLVFLTWVFYVIAAQAAWMILPGLQLPMSPVAAIEPFRIANQYGLFAVMTRGRYEIEFQGSNDGQNGTLPFPLQASGPAEGSRNLRSLPAAIRLEPLVRLPGRLGAQSIRGLHGGKAFDRLALRAGAVSRPIRSPTPLRRKCGQWFGNIGSVIQRKRMRECGGAAS